MGDKKKMEWNGMDGFAVLMLKIEICWESLLMDYRARPTVLRRF